MKFCRFETDEKECFGIFRDELIYPLREEGGLPILETIDERGYREDEIRFLPPVRPSKIVCVGRNYAAHAAELGNDLPTEPLLFLKAPTSLIVDGEPIVIPPQSRQVEHEGELAVIIGRICKNLSDTAEVKEYVNGYVCLNDVTARDIQRRDVQFTRAKSFDTFCAIGKYIESDVDPRDLRLTVTVNDSVRQNGRTSQMVFPVDHLIRYISNQMTLLPGDIIATGTPSGVSKLNPGDVCRVEIENVGELSNPVV